MVLSPVCLIVELMGPVAHCVGSKWCSHLVAWAQLMRPVAFCVGRK